MLDQASGLRELFAPPARASLAVCGSDDAALTAQLADAVHELGHRVVILDRSVGQVAHACGLRARYDLLHVMNGHCGLEQALVRTPRGVAVLPAARGLDHVAAQSGHWEALLERAVPELARAFDVWLVHGLLPGAAPDVPVVLALAPSAGAVTAAYAQVKALSHAQHRHEFGVVVHRAPDAGVAREVFECVAATARRFLSAELTFLGYVPPARSARSAAHAAVLSVAQSLVGARRAGAH